MTQNDSYSDGMEQSETVYAGGLMNDDTYCIIVGETSLCGKLYRRLGHKNGADFAVHWCAEVVTRDEAESASGPRTELCEDCKDEGVGVHYTRVLSGPRTGRCPNDGRLSELRG